MKNKKTIVFLFFYLLFFTHNIFSYPLIQQLESKNVLFNQYQQEVQENIKAEYARKDISVSFYSYKATKNDTMFTIASRCCIPYESLVTLNSISESTQDLNGRTLILPTAEGLYIPLKPETTIEILLAKQYSTEIYSKNIVSSKINEKEYYFISNARFSPAQRAYFLDSQMHLPLEKSILTSNFGNRISPISGKWKFHNGIDMAAPLGTPVYACKKGKILEAVYNDSIFGNYIIIDHGNNMLSIYAHLSEISIKKNQNIYSGQVIGKVGTTGASTGPHLHFEIRVNGSAQDPSKFLN